MCVDRRWGEFGVEWRVRAGDRVGVDGGGGERVRDERNTTKKD